MMRLTLRTLLAWLDDTLPATQVREIGKQVAETAYAQELVEKIHRVTRQRRLTVPGRSGPESTDPNLVAEYVDNCLDAEAVAEYEKKCLTSDVNLAEVASVHQILSLLGQKVQVPAETKARMYQLVKGRESIPRVRHDGHKPPPPQPVTQPIQPWVVPEPPRQHWIERFGPVAGCLALLAILCWSAYRSLTPPRVEAPLAGVGSSALVLPPGKTAGAMAAAGATATGHAPTAPEAPRGEPASVKDAAPAPPAAVKAPTDSSPAAPEPAKPAPPRETPAGALGVVDRVEGVLHRYSNEKREWERVAGGTALSASDRLLCLEPFRARIVLSRTPITLIGETQARVTEVKPGQGPGLELVTGRAVIEAPTSPEELRVELAGRTLAIDHPSQGLTGLERLSPWRPGQPPAQPPGLLVLASEGEVKLSLDQASETLEGPGRTLVDPAGKLRRQSDRTLPAWLTERQASPADQKLSEQFARVFTPEGHALTDVVVATESESAATRKLAICAVKALGDLSLLTPILYKPKDPVARQCAAAALRSYLAQGPLAGRRLREQLDREFGEGDSAAVAQLLIGMTPEEGRKTEALSRLVEYLSPDQPSLVIRELALEQLRSLTGRNAQGYDPEQPDEQGYENWKSALGKGELKPAAKQKAAG